MKKIEVEILKEGNNAKYKDDIGKNVWMDVDIAEYYSKRGIVKILSRDRYMINSKGDIKETISKKKVKKSVKKQDRKQIKLKVEIDPIQQIIERMKGENKRYIQIFAGDDKKTQKKIYESFFEINNCDVKQIKDCIDKYDSLGSYGVFFNYNPLNAKKRIAQNIINLNYIFIDLDDGATEEHRDLILDNLNKMDISYSYVAKSGHGYHILIPIDLSTENKNKVKGFLTYLRDNICNKVDVATHTNERLFRIPNSYHKKDEDNKKLITYHSVIPTQKEIEINNKNILEYQLEQKKGSKDKVYLSSIKVKDIFFTEILNNKNSWHEYIKSLHNSKDRNDNFIKNLGFFIFNNESLYDTAVDFLNSFEPARIPAMDGWIKKAEEYNTTPLYYELLKWSEDNKIMSFIDLLRKQTKKTFLDNYEIYYLEDEKKENNTLLYFPEKNYYVQKGINEVLLNIYYDAKERGVDFVEELNLEEQFEEWDNFTFTKQLNLIQQQIRRLIEQENRIKLVFNINYEPSESKFIYEDNKKYFNIYNKTLLWDYYKQEKTYHFPHIKELLLNLCGEDRKNYIWFCKWISWQIKYPTQKLPTAVILQGKQGSGKGTLKNLIFDNIFGNNCQEINQTHLESSFNDYLLGKQVIFANEVMHNENRQTLPNVLKNLVTDEEITINIKFKKSIKGRNYTQWIFCTNSDNPIKIDEDDRRYSVFYSKKLRKGLGHDIRKNLDYELKQFISYLKDLEVDFEEVEEPIMTDAKQDIIDLNKDSVSRFQEYCLGFQNINDLWNNLFDSKKQDLVISRPEGTFITSDNFYLIYEKYCALIKERGVYAKQNFSRKLTNFDIKTDVKRIDKITLRVYELEKISKIFFSNKN